MIQMQAITKTYGRGRRATTALRAVDLEVPRGEFLCLRGPSGSGKTTLLMLAGAMLHPSAGAVRMEGTSLYELRERERAAWRAEKIGFVFQMFHLVPYLDLADNVRLAGGGRRGSRAEAAALLERMGLAGRISHRPAELSAGERQRAAMARALFNHPSLVLADEPTGNLDEESAEMALDLMAEYHRSGGTVILVTHGRRAARRADRVLELRAGELVA